MVAWAVWNCNRELVSLLLTQPFGIYYFLVSLLDFYSIFTYVNKGACACAYTQNDYDFFHVVVEGPKGCLPAAQFSC